MRTHRRTVFGAVALSVMLLALAAPTAAADERFRVCSITINSDDEIETFREHLPPSEFEVVELTEMGRGKAAPGREPPWLSAACAADLRCDVLVVSGHFSDVYAGSFGTTFAGESGLSLALETLERRRCEQSCPGLLAAPLEVFLFGCRTLATGLEGAPLSADDRALFEEHGVSGSAAGTLLDEVRHRGEETRNERRMRFVFAGVPSLYGFSWTAPTGTSAAPLLDRYFERIGDYGARLRELGSLRAAGRSPAPNRTLAGSMTLGTFTQSSGFRGDDAELRHDQVSCLLRSERSPIGARLERAESQLDGQGFLTHLGAVSELLRTIEGDSLSGADEASLERIRRHEPTRRATLDLARHVESPALRLEAIRVAAALGWLGDDEALAARRDVVLQLLDPPTYGEGRDVVCDMEPEVLRRIQIRAEDLDDDVYGDEYAIAALACLEPSDPEIHVRLGRALSDRREWVARAAARTLRVLKPAEVPVQLELVRQLGRPEKDVRSSVEEAIREIEPEDPAVVAALREAAPAFPIDWR